MKKFLKITGLILAVILVIYCISFLIFSLYAKNKNNETYFKTTYESVEGQDIYIPKYSYFKEECCATAAIFHSLVPKFILEQKIENYMKDFTYFREKGGYGYRKDDLYIQRYEVKDYIFYRKIVIVY